MSSAASVVIRATALAKSNRSSPPSRGFPARTSSSGNESGSTSCSSLTSPFATGRPRHVVKQLRAANVAAVTMATHSAVPRQNFQAVEGLPCKPRIAAGTRANATSTSSRAGNRSVKRAFCEIAIPARGRIVARSSLNVVLMTRRGTRPARGEIDEVALQLLARHGAQILATARRHSVTPEDAEDAYQRGIEILLTKAPSTIEDELIRWLKTVVKREAWALRRQRERHSPVTDDGELRDRPAPGAVTHEQAERLERLRLAAEALGHLKPHEVRALRLKAEGFSYREICAMTGWSYTKVNRLLTEGRRAFLRRVSGIERGADCSRYEPLLSALADGEASAEQLAILRPHMRTCLSCRARLREFRATPARVAALVPPAALVASHHEGPLQSLIESAVGAAQHRTAVMGERMHAAAELATGQKVAAVAASAAALAGGGTAIDEFANHQGPPLP